MHSWCFQRRYGPPGTSLLQAPFVAIGGWRTAPLASVLALVAMVLLLRVWLETAGRPQIFALVPLMYPPTVVFGRLGMSDVPSGAIVTLGLLCFWRGLNGGNCIGRGKGIF